MEGCLGHGFHPPCTIKEKFCCRKSSCLQSYGPGHQPCRAYARIQYGGLNKRIYGLLISRQSALYSDKTTGPQYIVRMMKIGLKLYRLFTHGKGRFDIAQARVDITQM